ncbi:hypothetical protein BDN67DRAFT_628774 [Paxillus ammoniavirescens]|nr:hypothetical protein BDN67DRAFT_628774 [Paxillus ammoniavirescens]
MGCRAVAVCDQHCCDFQIPALDAMCKMPKRCWSRMLHYRDTLVVLEEILERDPSFHTIRALFEDVDLYPSTCITIGDYQYQLLIVVMPPCDPVIRFIPAHMLPLWEFFHLSEWHPCAAESGSSFATYGHIRQECQFRCTT